MQWHSALFGLTVLGSVSTVPLNAQEEQGTTRLEDITVTATRVPVSARSVTSSITLLRGEDLRAQGITHVLDATSAGGRDYERGIGESIRLAGGSGSVEGNPAIRAPEER